MSRAKTKIRIRTEIEYAVKIYEQGLKEKDFEKLEEAIRKIKQSVGL